MKKTKRILAIILIIAGTCIQLNAATFTVTNTTDADPGSLRQAILDANILTGADTIDFDAIVFATPQTITLTSALPINSDLTITGPGADLLAIDGNNATRIFYDDFDTNDVIISGLEIKNGNDGAFVVRNAHLTLRYCDIHSNSVGSYGTISIASYPDGVSSLTVENSAIHHNVTAGYAAGIYIDNASALSISNSTLYANSGPLHGIAIMGNGAQVVLTNVTIAGHTTGNSAIQLNDNISPGNVHSSLSVRNCIFDNAISNYFGQAGTIKASLGRNISNDGSMATFLNHFHDFNNTSSMLDPAGLQDNGGATPTVALQCNSPALNATTNDLAIDQVGNVRGIVADIGAYESSIQPLVATGSGTNVTCFGGTDGFAAVTISGGPSTEIGLGPIGAPLIYQGAPNSPAISDTCDCPPGYVAVGFEANYGAFIDKFKLKCRQLLPDGTLGSGLATTCINGNSQNGTLVSDHLSASNEALVKYTIMESGQSYPNYYPKGMNADSKSISDIYSGSSNTSGLTNIGGFQTFVPYAAHSETAPDGNVIVGMINYFPNISGWTQGVQFRYAPVTDVPASVQYLWSNGATTSSISNLTAGTYTVTVTKGGYSTTASYTVTEPPQFSPAIIGNTSFCAGSSTTLSTGTFSSYLWSTGATTQSVPVNTAGNFSVTVTNANGCTGSASVTTIINALPSCTITGNSFVCSGGSTPWCAPAGLAYSWSTGASTQCVTLNATGNYSVTTTDVKGCSSTCSKSFTVGNALTIDAGLNKIVYKGYADSACTTLTATGAGGGTPPYTLTWTGGSHANSITVCPTVSTTYYLTITDANNCSKKDSVRVCVLDVRCGSGNKKVTICHGTGSAQNPFVTLCIDPADAKWHFINHPGEKLGACGMVKTCGFNTLREGEEEIQEGQEDEMSLMVYPNPATSEINISFHCDVDATYLLRLVSMTGQILLTETKKVSEGENKFSVNLQDVAPGIYLVLMQEGENIMQARIIKE